MDLNIKNLATIDDVQKMINRALNGVEEEPKPRQFPELMSFKVAMDYLGITSYSTLNKYVKRYSLKTYDFGGKRLKKSEIDKAVTRSHV